MDWFGSLSLEEGAESAVKRFGKQRELGLSTTIVIMVCLWLVIFERLVRKIIRQNLSVV